MFVSWTAGAGLPYSCSKELTDLLCQLATAELHTPFQYDWKSKCQRAIPVSRLSKCCGALPK